MSAEMADGVTLPKPTAPQAAWHDLELGMFIHFDLFTWHPAYDFRSWRHLPKPGDFQPTKLDTDQWLEAAVGFGAKYAVLTARHCMGFCLWPTDVNDYTHSVKYSSWGNGKRDVVGEFVNSCRKYGVKPGFYCNMHANEHLEVDNCVVNRGKGGDPEKQKAYARYCEQTLTELCTRYGEVFEIWCDGGVLPASRGGPDILPILAKHQPNAVVFQGPPCTPHPLRWVGNERGVAPYPCWSTVDKGSSEDGMTEKDMAGNGDAKLWAPAEVDVPMRKGEWGWKANQEHLVHSLDTLMAMYCESVGRNCNLLLNSNPNTDGLIPDVDMQRYKEFGAEIKRRFGKPLAETSGRGDAVVLNLKKPATIDHAIIMEQIAEGERIRECALEGWTGDRWKPLCTGSCVGHKRIERFAPVNVSKVRLTVTKALAEPLIRRLALYRVG
jgi:alpha-L-fucosidase